MTEYRASFDAAVRFSNGGDLSMHGFRVDVPSSGADETTIAALFVASLGLRAVADRAGRHDPGPRLRPPPRLTSPSGGPA